LIDSSVYDNNPYNEELEMRWGFSCLVEGLEKTILFDVGGEGSVLLKNMEKLKVDPKKVNVILLSHIHYDHIGGLSDFLKKNPLVTVYMPKSFPQSIKDKVKQVGAELVEVHSSMEICKNAYSTGELGSWIKEESLCPLCSLCSNPYLYCLCSRKCCFTGYSVCCTICNRHSNCSYSAREFTSHSLSNGR